MDGDHVLEHSIHNDGEGLVLHHGFTENKPHGMAASLRRPCTSVSETMCTATAAALHTRAWHTACWHVYTIHQTT